MSPDELNQAAAQLTKYFRPNPYKHGRLTRIHINAEGQQVKTCTTLDGQGVTADLIKQHLRASPGFLALGYLPGDDAGTASGMADFDLTSYPTPGELDDAFLRFLDVAYQYGVKVYPETSTRGGRHAHVFIADPLPHDVVSAALRVMADKAALAKTEVYPAGGSPLSTWLILPYAGAVHDGLGRTQLTTDAGQIIPVTELDEWLELTPAENIQALADLLPEHDPQDVTDGPADDLKPEAVTAICEAAKNPPIGTFDRHGSLVAFINLGGRCGRLSEVVHTLKSEKVRTTWAADGSRDADEWSKEVDRWLSATGTRRRGIKSLLDQGFRLGQLPTIADDSQNQIRFKLSRKPRSRISRVYARMRGWGNGRA
jgi:hypothetical protein